MYPRLGFLETFLSSKFNPIVTLGKSSLKGFANKFNGDVELLDDLVFNFLPSLLASWSNFLLKNDHWTSKHNIVLFFALHRDFQLI